MAGLFWKDVRYLHQTVEISAAAQANPRRQIWAQEVANWRNRIQNRTTVLPLLVSMKTRIFYAIWKSFTQLEEFSKTTIRWPDTLIFTTSPPFLLLFSCFENHRIILHSSWFVFLNRTLRKTENVDLSSPETNFASLKRTLVLFVQFLYSTSAYNVFYLFLTAFPTLVALSRRHIWVQTFVVMVPHLSRHISHVLFGVGHRILNVIRGVSSV